MKHGSWTFLVLLALMLLVANAISAAYLTDVPTVVMQPDKTELSCFASGDEFHNWLHDADGYTIIQSPQTGYYVYAEKIGEELVAGTLIAGRDNPTTRGLVPKLNISKAAYRQKASNLWQLGYPNQTVINAPYFGYNAWMTDLSQNYPHYANFWLMSPPLDFSEVSIPKLRFI